MTRFHNLNQRLKDAVEADPPVGEPATPPSPPAQPDEPDDENNPQPAEAPAGAADLTDKAAKEQSLMTDPIEQTDAYRAGFTAANARMSAVFASAEYVGREAQAAKLLGKDSLSATDITELLGDYPVAEQLSPDQQKAAAEEAGRKDMAAAMEASGNADLGASKPAADASTERAEIDQSWDKAHSTVQKGAK